MAKRGGEAERRSTVTLTSVGAVVPTEPGVVAPTGEGEGDGEASPRNVAWSKCPQAEEPDWSSPQETVDADEPHEPQGPGAVVPTVEITALGDVTCLGQVTEKVALASDKWNGPFAPWLPEKAQWPGSPRGGRSVSARRGNRRFRFGRGP